MNLSTVALALLAWQLLTNKSTPHQQDKSSPLDNISQFMSADAKNIVDCVQKLSSNNTSSTDKTSAIIQMMTNPAVMNMASSLFKQEDKASPVVNEEGFKFEQPSRDSQDFFKPIDNIADAEVKHKLYWFYDNWYVNK